MPQEPKRRHSRQRQGKRRASISFSLLKLGECKNCHQKTYPHQICKNCGFYDGRLVYSTTSAKKKNDEREK